MENTNIEKSLLKLKEGNERFFSGKSDHPRIDLERMRETALNGQKPFATIIACSDSRVPVEIIFDQGIGDIFSVRIAGNVCNVDEIASIEYAVEHLKTPILVVLGHTKCGAVTTVANNDMVNGNIEKLVENITIARDKVKLENPDLNGEDFIDAVMKENIYQSIRDLLSNSKVVEERVDSGLLKIVPAIYNLIDGRITWL